MIENKGKKIDDMDRIKYLFNNVVNCISRWCPPDISWILISP